MEALDGANVGQASIDRIGEAHILCDFLLPICLAVTAANTSYYRHCTSLKAILGITLAKS